MIKGIVHNFFLYRSNLIFWIVMGCGIADFGRRGLKTPKTQHFWVFILSPGTSTRGATRDLDSWHRGPQQDLELSYCARSTGILEAPTPTPAAVQEVLVDHWLLCKKDWYTGTSQEVLGAAVQARPVLGAHWAMQAYWQLS